MEKKDIEKLINESRLKEEDIQALVDKRVSAAIEERKKAVSKQFKVWGGAISTVFSFLLIIGFSTDDIVSKVRNTILPKSYMVAQLVTFDEQSAKLKNNIISELDDPDLKKYPNTKNTIQANVWKALSTDDEDQLKKFLTKTKLDEVVIDSYYDEVVNVLFSDKASDNKKQKELILEAGSVPEKINIGEFENKSNTKTNCGIDFTQTEKRVIIHVPAPEDGEKREKIPTPWFQCPRGYHAMDVSLKVEGKIVDGIKVVGIERPTDPPKNVIRGIRARVTKAVADEFRKQGVDIGAGIVPGSIWVTRVHDDL